MSLFLPSVENIRGLQPQNLCSIIQTVLLLTDITTKMPLSYRISYFCRIVTFAFVKSRFDFFTKLVFVEQKLARLGNFKHLLRSISCLTKTTYLEILMHVNAS